MSTTKDPQSGLFMVPAATFGYQVFANESAFQTLFLDRIGDHETSAHYLETFLKLQGSVPLPGTFTGSQKGVLHGTKVDNDYNYTMGPYNLDHGTVLWGLAQHYLMSGDSQWLEHAAAGMLQAADWIIEQRNTTKQVDENGRQVLHYGLLPAGRLEDNDDWGYWFANNAYAWLGLRDTARAFQRAGLPAGDRLAQEADAYIKDLRAAVRRTSELAPVVRLRNNVYVPFVPSRVYQRFRYFGPMRSGYYSRYKKDTLAHVPPVGDTGSLVWPADSDHHGRARPPRSLVGSDPRRLGGQHHPVQLAGSAHSRRGRRRILVQPRRHGLSAEPAKSDPGVSAAERFPLDKVLTR